MIEFNLQRVDFSDNVKVDCKISYEKGQSITNLQYSDHEFGSLTFAGSDLFSALEQIRKYLEDKGFLLLCAGAMPNTYPSRMSRQMSNGRKAYVHTFGMKPDKSNIIDIFKPANLEEVSNLKDQEKFMKEWHDYFKE